MSKTNRQIVTEFKRSLHAFYAGPMTMERIEKACDELFPLIDQLQSNEKAFTASSRRAAATRVIRAAAGPCMELRKSLAREMAKSVRQAASDLLSRPYADLAQSASGDASDIPAYLGDVDKHLSAFAMFAGACFKRCDVIGLRESAINMYLHSFVDEGGIPVQAAKVGENLFYRSSIQRISAVRSAIQLFLRQFKDGLGTEPEDRLEWRLLEPLDAQELVFGFDRVSFRLQYRDSLVLNVDLYPEYNMRVMPAKSM